MKEVRPFKIVKRDQRHVAGHREAEIAECTHCTDGHLVVSDDQGRWRPLSSPHMDHRRMRGVALRSSALEQLWLERQASVGQTYAIASDALIGRAQPMKSR